MPTFQCRCGTEVTTFKPWPPKKPKLCSRCLTEDRLTKLEARVTALEPGFFVQTLRRIAAGEIVL